jgi:hypothetical protein
MLVSGVVAGFILGLASGGDWRRLGQLDLKLLPALVAAAVSRAVAPFFGELALGISMLGLALIAVVALVNRALPGAWLVALGSMLNLLVISINGGMPVEPGALTSAGKSLPNDGLHVLLAPGTRLGFLADVLLAPIVNNVYSVGDVLLAAGGFWMAFRVLRQR